MKKEELKPDVVLKDYWNNKSRFADLFNALLFNGENEIKAEDLENEDIESSTVFEHKEFEESLQAARDNLKIVKRLKNQNLELMLLGIENQEKIHYAMPLRVMGYDYVTYKKQYEDKALKHKEDKYKGMTSDEFMSKIKKEDKFTPVITVVIYYGSDPWDGPLSLYDMLDIPEYLKKFVPDYKMNLIEARKTSLKLSNIENHNFFKLAEILLDNSQKAKCKKDKAIKYCEKYLPGREVERAIAVAAGFKLKTKNLENGDDGMKTFFEELREEEREELREELKEELKEELREEREEGTAIGVINTGFKLNLAKDKIIKLLQETLEISSKEAENYYKKYREK